MRDDLRERRDAAARARASSGTYHLPPATGTCVPSPWHARVGLAATVGVCVFAVAALLAQCGCGGGVGVRCPSAASPAGTSRGGPSCPAVPR